ncbi:hypothetical protein L1987_12883 [Smallanthus sonchifolius]|uniref:Uncharacterized protein n=1 Tax=Smallanthus sonchifolius TaxID=185202 RepID=A0ACB9JH99_9ASTR|nr:hypothetical protein L1987_12883 [Smallanthus sonchifolius]
MAADFCCILHSLSYYHSWQLVMLRSKSFDDHKTVGHGCMVQMLKLEKMRLDFRKELKPQKKKILERAQTEIAIREGV